MISIFRSLFSPPRHLVLLLAALWIGLALSEKRAERHGMSRDSINSIIYYALFGYVIGGRLLYVISNYSIFLQSPLSVFSINLDLFDPVAGLVIAFIVGVAYCSRPNLPFWSSLNALTPFFATIAIGVSLSHLAAGTAFGSETDLPWGIELWNATRHPAQIYELVAALFIFALLWFRKAVSPPGSDFLLFVALTAGARLFLEAFRGDSTLIFGGVRLAQVLAWIVLAAALFANDRIRREVQLK